MRQEPMLVVRAIPGYEGKYWITNEGDVYNENHKLKPIPSSSGLRVELRQSGQRESYLIADLLKLTFPEVST